LLPLYAPVSATEKRIIITTMPGQKLVAPQFVLQSALRPGNVGEDGPYCPSPVVLRRDAFQLGMKEGPTILLEHKLARLGRGRLEDLPSVKINASWNSGLIRS